MARPEKVTERTVNAWTAVHAPRMNYARDHAPSSSWWTEVEPSEFYDRARREFETRMVKSQRQTGQRGIDG